ARGLPIDCSGRACGMGIVAPDSVRMPTAVAMCARNTETIRTYRELQFDRSARFGAQGIAHDRSVAFCDPLEKKLVRGCDRRDSIVEAHEVKRCDPGLKSDLSHALANAD